MRGFHFKKVVAKFLYNVICSVVLAFVSSLFFADKYLHSITEEASKRPKGQKAVGSNISCTSMLSRSFVGQDLNFTVL